MQSLSGQTGSPGDYRRNSSWYIYVILVVVFGVLTSLGAAHYVYRVLDTQHQDQFLDVVHTREMQITGSLDQQLGHIRALRSLMTAMPDLDQRTFQVYAERLQEGFPQLRDLAWIPVVGDQDGPAFLATMDKDLGRGFVRKLQMLVDNPRRSKARTRLLPLTFLSKSSKRTVYQGTDLSDLPDMLNALQSVERCGCSRVFPDVMAETQSPVDRSLMILAPVRAPTAFQQSLKANEISGFVAIFFHLDKPLELEERRVGKSLPGIILSIVTGKGPRELYRHMPDEGQYPDSSTGIPFEIDLPYAGSIFNLKFFQAGSVLLRGRDIPAYATLTLGLLLTLFILAYSYRVRRLVDRQRLSVQLLEQNQEMLRAQFLNFPIPTYSWQKQDEDFYLVDFNDAAIAFTRGKVQEFKGISLSKMYKDLPEVIDNVQTCFRSGRPIEAFIQYPYTELGVRDLEVKYVPVPPDMVMIHAEDISVRKHAEQMLQLSESRLNAAQELASLGYFYFNSETGENSWSASLYEILGLDPDMVEPNMEALLEYVAAEHRDYLRQHISAYGQDATDRDNTIKIDFRVQRPDKSVRILIGRIVRKTSESGKPVVFGVVQDVTETKQTELALRQAKEEADRAQQERTRFFSRMTHELRTPLNAILGFAQILNLDVKEPADRESVAEILRAGTTLMRILDDVLDLAEMETGTLALNNKPLELVEVMRRASDEYRELADKFEIKIIDRLPLQDCYVVNADADRLLQAVGNLLSNAIKYNRANGRVTVCLKQARKGFIRVLVEDTGIGLSEEQKQRFIEPFERLGLEYGSVEGAGLGLVIARKLVELMGASLGFNSTAGKGSCFWVEFPLVRQFKRKEGGGENAQSAEKELGSILYIEDNPANLRFITQVVRDMTEYKLYTANTLSNGLDLVRSLRPNLVLMDINLPDHDGYYGLERMRRMPETQDIPVVALTASAMNEDMLKGLKAGFNEYLSKPVSVKRLLETFNKYL